MVGNRLATLALVSAVAVIPSCANHADRHAPVQEQRRPELVSLLGRALFAAPPGDRAKLESDLTTARRDLSADPEDPARHVWVGRRLGYLWRMNDAVEVYTRALELFPDYAPLYRHRGHRYISLRRFDDAVADLEKAAALIEGKPDEIEPDGMPNARNIPLTTTAFNVWYHLGLARYLKGDLDGALAAFRETMKHATRYDDNIVATTDWMCMTLRRIWNSECRMASSETESFAIRHSQFAILDAITPDMEIIENTAYHRRLLMYKGLIDAEDLLNLQTAGDLELATLGYGLGRWYLDAGDRAKAKEVFHRVTSGPYWPAFGFIAAEVDLEREFRMSNSE